MRAISALVVLILLASCASPRERCVSQATKDLRTLDRLIQETEANIQRGFGLEKEERFRTRREYCGEDEDGDRIYCRQQESYTVNVPITINIDEEKAKLAQLRQSRARVSEQTASALELCSRLPDN